MTIVALALAGIGIGYLALVLWCSSPLNVWERGVLSYVLAAVASGQLLKKTRMFSGADRDESILIALSALWLPMCFLVAGGLLAIPWIVEPVVLVATRWSDRKSGGLK